MNTLFCKNDLYKELKCQIKELLETEIGSKAKKLFNLERKLGSEIIFFPNPTYSGTNQNNCNSAGRWECLAQCIVCDRARFWGSRVPHPLSILFIYQTFSSSTLLLIQYKIKGSHFYPPFTRQQMWKVRNNGKKDEVMFYFWLDRAIHA